MLLELKEHLHDFSRYIQALVYGLRAIMGKSKTKRQKQLVHANCDLTLLSLLESFMEGAPQLMLQLYIMQKIGTKDGLIMGNIITLHRHMH